MKDKHIKGILTAITIFFICYLLGSFHAVSLNIADWEEDARTTCVIIGSILSGAGFIFSIGFGKF